MSDLTPKARKALETFSERGHAVFPVGTTEGLVTMGCRALIVEMEGERDAKVPHEFFVNDPSYTKQQQACRGSMAISVMVPSDRYDETKKFCQDNHGREITGLTPGHGLSRLQR